MSNEPANKDDEQKEWSRRKQIIGAVVWASFLSACFATMLFFAHFDPVLFAFEEGSWLHFSNAMSGYAVGFFFFWAIAAIAATLAAFLLHPALKSRDSNDERTQVQDRK